MVNIERKKQSSCVCLLGERYSRTQSSCACLFKEKDTVEPQIESFQRWIKQLHKYLRVLREEFGPKKITFSFKWVMNMKNCKEKTFIYKQLLTWKSIKLWI